MVGADPVRYNAYQNAEGRNTLQLASESKESVPVDAGVIMNSSYELVGYKDGTSEEHRNENKTLAYSPCLIHPHTPTLQRSHSPTQYNPLTQEVQYQVWRETAQLITEWFIQITLGYYY